YGPLAKDGALLRDLGAAYERAGRIAKAIEVYGQAAALTAGRLYEGDAYARSFYDLGRLLPERGDRAKAADNLRRFLELWKDADPGRPEVADAQARLSALDAPR
ncbi:MAG: tetratricopeptide repeat protein, partial [Candidatus Aminicenantes bacterium]|nr:tetratricopeptide repeat protein [Candidatus Aminicenantes bacterium]